MRVLARGVMWREGEWLFNVYARPGDRLPTLRVRRLSRKDKCMDGSRKSMNCLMHFSCINQSAVDDYVHRKCMKNDDYVCRKCMNNDEVLHEKCFTSLEAGTGNHASRQLGGIIFEG